MSHNVFGDSARPCSLDIYQKRDNSLCEFNAHRRESGLVHQKEVIDLVGLMRITGRVISCTKGRITSCTAEKLALCTAAIFIVSLIIITKLRLICLLASAVLNWSVMHLFDSLSRRNRLYELNTWPNSCR